MDRVCQNARDNLENTASVRGFDIVPYHILIHYFLQSEKALQTPSQTPSRQSAKEKQDALVASLLKGSTSTDKVVDAVDKYGGANLGGAGAFNAGHGRGIVFLAWGAWAAKRVSKLNKVRRASLCCSLIHVGDLRELK